MTLFKQTRNMEHTLTPRTRSRGMIFKLCLLSALFSAAAAAAGVVKHSDPFVIEWQLEDSLSLTAEVHCISSKGVRLLLRPTDTEVRKNIFEKTERWEIKSFQDGNILVMGDDNRAYKIISDNANEIFEA